MKKARGTPAKPATPVPRTKRNRVGGIATLLPLAVSMIPTVASVTSNARQPSATPPTATASRRQPAAREFSIPINDLRQWATTVVVTMPNVTIEGNSKVHRADADCEIHFGAHAAGFNGEPPGLVLEPMNACVEPFPGQTEQRDSDYIKFANDIRNQVVTISGVPRIWPEHLTGGGGPSNPDHAIEFHPLTAVQTGTNTAPVDFSKHVFAGEYTGGVGQPTAERLVNQTSVTVTTNGNLADISFFGGRIGNFTTLDLTVDKASIVSDGAGSFRMKGDVVLEDGTTVLVNMVTVKGSPINDRIESLKRRRSAMISLGEILVLFSLSPEALMNAVNQSNGNPVQVVTPLQLILYGAPDV